MSGGNGFRHLAGIALCTSMICVSASCSPDELPSGQPSRSASAVGPVANSKLRNRSVTGPLKSIVVHYQRTAPIDRLAKLMLPGVQVAFDVPRHSAISLDVAEASSDSLVRAFRAMPWVTRIEVASQRLRADGSISLHKSFNKVARTETVPWGIHAVQADAARLVYSSIGYGVKIGLIDSGIDCSVGEVADRVVGGYDFVTDAADACTSGTPNYHGTSVASIIAAIPNGAGLVGVATGANIYNLRTIDGSGINSYGRVTEAINWAIDNDLQVLNLSFGDCGMPEDTLLSNVADAIDDAVAAGIVVVAAGGNGTAGPSFCQSTDSVSNVAIRAGVIAVSAIRQDSTVPSAYQHGPQIDLAAPTNVYADSIGGVVWVFSGTSSSVPHVTGAVALMLEAGFSASNVLAGLTSQAQIQQSSHSITLGWGMLDVLAAIRPTPQFDSTSTDCSTPLYSGPCGVQVYVRSGLGIAPLSYRWQVTYSGSVHANVDSTTSSSSFSFEVPTGPDLSYSIELYATVSDSISGRRRTSVGADLGWVVCPGEALRAGLFAQTFRVTSGRFIVRPQLGLAPNSTDAICP